MPTEGLLVLFYTSVRMYCFRHVYLHKKQQKVGRLWVSEVMTANLIPGELINLLPNVTFSKPTVITNIDICTLSAESHSSGSESYDQTGKICGVKADTTGSSYYNTIL